MGAENLLALCKEKKLTVCSCESLTAGLFCDTIASVPGASAVLKGGLVTYFTAMKTVLAHVSKELIEAYGVVSGQCARAMAENTREIMSADYCVSFTGNAGPSAMEGKKAGLVYTAIAYKSGCRVFEFDLEGFERNELRARLVEIMIEKLIEEIEEGEDNG